MTAEYWEPGGRRDRNERTRAKAEHAGEPWSKDEDEFVLEFLGDDFDEDELVEVAEALGRTAEATRQRRNHLVAGRVGSGPSYRVTTSTTTTTTTKTTTHEYRGALDDDEDRWWDPSSSYYKGDS